MFKNTGILWFNLFVQALAAHPAHAQSHISKKRFETDSAAAFLDLSSVISSSLKTPFWLKANQFGMVSNSPSALRIQGFIQRYWTLSPAARDEWRVGGALEVGSNLSISSRILLPQAHLALRFRNWEFFAGRKKQWIGLADSTLGTGSYSWSGNAMPIPKVQIGTSGFVAVPLSGGWVSFNGFYSEGFLKRAGQ